MNDHNRLFILCIALFSCSITLTNPDQNSPQNSWFSYKNFAFSGIIFGSLLKVAPSIWSKFSTNILKREYALPPEQQKTLDWVGTGIAIGSLAWYLCLKHNKPQRPRAASFPTDRLRTGNIPTDISPIRPVLQSAMRDSPGSPNSSKGSVGSYQDDELNG